MWKSIFQLSQSKVDFKKPLTHDILSNSSHPFVKTIIYIYTMESFIFREMNKASRNKDTSKIEFYGAFASALGYIVNCGSFKKYSENHESVVVYRGAQISVEELEQKTKIGSIITLTGFSSSSLSRESTLGFALNNLSAEDDPNKQPVIYEIKFQGNNQYFNICSKNYSAYPDE